MRLFISADIPEGTINEIYMLTSKVRNNELLKSRIKWEMKEKLHITLLFIGEIPAGNLHLISSSLENISSRAGIIPVVITAVIPFPSLKKPRVIALHIEDEGKLTKLAHAIDESLVQAGIKRDKPFRAHITLGRVKRNEKIKLSDKPLLLNIKTKIKTVSLIESKLKSHGSEYLKLCTYSIGQ